MPTHGDIDSPSDRISKMRFTSRIASAVKACLIITMMLQQVAVGSFVPAINASSVGCEAKRSGPSGKQAKAMRLSCSGCGNCKVANAEDACQCCQSRTRPAKAAETEPVKSCCRARRAQFRPTGVQDASNDTLNAAETAARRQVKTDRSARSKDLARPNAAQCEVAQSSASTSGTFLSDVAIVSGARRAKVQAAQHLSASEFALHSKPSTTTQRSSRCNCAGGSNRTAPASEAPSPPRDARDDVAKRTMEGPDKFLRYRPLTHLAKDDERLGISMLPDVQLELCIWLL